MNIRKFWRLSCLTVASLFWASCTESNPQFPITLSANPDSSSDANGGGFSNESSSSAAAPESSSSEIVASQKSSSSGISSSNNSNSSIASSSSRVPLYALARDTSVACMDSSFTSHNCDFSEKRYSCDEYKEYLGKDSTISARILAAWEDGLQSCGAILLPIEVLYGPVDTPACAKPHTEHIFKCSDGSTYAKYKLEGNLIYANEDEYDEAHGISYLVKTCKQDEFALFLDILADVQKVLYEKFAKLLEDFPNMNERDKRYLDELLDHEKKTLNGRYSPYLSRDDDYAVSELRWMSEFWFDGYIAKTKTCEDGIPVMTERYQKMYNSIFYECLSMIDVDLETYYPLGWKNNQ